MVFLASSFPTRHTNFPPPPPSCFARNNAATVASFEGRWHTAFCLCRIQDHGLFTFCALHIVVMCLFVLDAVSDLADPFAVWASRWLTLLALFGTEKFRCDASRKWLWHAAPTIHKDKTLSFRFFARFGRLRRTRLRALTTLGRFRGVLDRGLLRA